VSQIRTRVSEPIPGEIRLQYWVDLLAGTEHGNTLQNPLAQGLLSIIDQYDLPTGPLRRLLAARRFDLYDDAMPDMLAFEGYAGETNSILYQLACLIVNKGNDAGGADAAGHLGVAHTLIGHLRTLPVTAARGQIFLPWSVFAQRGVNESDYLSAKATPALVSGCDELRDIAHQHLLDAKREIGELSADVRPVFAKISILEKQLSRLEDFGSIPFAPPPDIANWQKIAMLLWWAIRN
jgi:phytoene synthase